MIAYDPEIRYVYRQGDSIVNVSDGWPACVGNRGCPGTATFIFVGSLRIDVYISMGLRNSILHGRIMTEALSLFDRMVAAT